MAQRFLQLGGAFGAEQALREMVASRIAAEQEAAAAQQQQFENEMKFRQVGQGDRRMDIDTSQFDATHGLNVRKVDEDVRQFDAQAPHREAQTGYLKTQTRDLEQKPLYAEQSHQNELAQIKARGDQSVRAAGIRTTDEPLVAVVGPDGKPVLVRRSDALGKTPASNREQTGARPIISGDANRIADFDTSLDDLKVLGGEVSGAGSTGIMPGLGAVAPNFVTNLTGFGTEAKSRQGTIDRVKQVIGKALEGGVLRKEDEYKYAKILPTISDHPDVVKSKLQDLQTAITQRRQTLLDSLGDAGYDTTRYNERAPRQPEGLAPGTKRVINGVPAVWDGKGWLPEGGQ